MYKKTFKFSDIFINANIIIGNNIIEVILIDKIKANNIEIYFKFLFKLSLFKRLIITNEIQKRKLSAFSFTE